MSILNRCAQQHKVGCTGVIVAAGSASRMGGIDKIMADLRGKPVIAHTISAFESSHVIDEIVLVARQERIEELKSLVAQYGFTKVRKIVPGGKTRMESVEAGLRAVSKKSRLVAIQDGARPMVTGKIIEDAVKAAANCGAAAPGIPVKDTVKVVGGDGKVIDTPDRSTLRAVQTPQVFDREMLMAAWAAARQQGKEYTDDCGAMEGIGMRVYITEGSEENIKITTPFDLKVAELIMKGRNA